MAGRRGGGAGRLPVDLIDPVAKDTHAAVGEKGATADSGAGPPSPDRRGVRAATPTPLGRTAAPLSTVTKVLTPRDVRVSSKSPVWYVRAPSPAAPVEQRDLAMAWLATSHMVAATSRAASSMPARSLEEAQGLVMTPRAAESMKLPAFTTTMVKPPQALVSPRDQIDRAGHTPRDMAPALHRMASAPPGHCSPGARPQGGSGTPGAPVTGRTSYSNLAGAVTHERSGSMHRPRTSVYGEPLLADGSRSVAAPTALPLARSVGGAATTTSTAASGAGAVRTVSSPSTMRAVSPSIRVASTVAAAGAAAAAAVARAGSPSPLATMPQTRKPEVSIYDKPASPGVSLDRISPGRSPGSFVGSPSRGIFGAPPADEPQAAAGHFRVRTVTPPPRATAALRADASPGPHGYSTPTTPRAYLPAKVMPPVTASHVAPPNARPVGSASSPSLVVPPARPQRYSLGHSTPGAAGYATPSSPPPPLQANGQYSGAEAFGAMQRSNSPSSPQRNGAQARSNSTRRVWKESSRAPAVPTSRGHQPDDEDKALTARCMKMQERLGRLANKTTLAL